MSHENQKKYNMDLKEDVEYLKQLVSKHAQLMHMFYRKKDIKQAKQQFEVLKPIFKILNDKGVSMDYYTLQDFNKDSVTFGSN